MRVENVTIKNWRPYNTEQGATLHLGNITVLSGQNDSGKSSFLLATYASILEIAGVNNPKFKPFLYDEGNSHADSYGEIKGYPKVNFFLSFDIYEKNFLLSNIGPKFTTDLMEFVLKFVKNLKIEFEINLESAKNNDLSGNERISTHIAKSIEIFRDKGIYTPDLKANFQSPDNLLLKVIKSFLQDSFFIEFLENIRCYYIPCSKESLLDNIFESETIGDNNKLGLINYIEYVCSEKGRSEGKYKRFIMYLRLIFPDIEGISVNISVKSKDIFLTWNNGNGNTRYQPLRRSGSGIVNSLYLVGRLLSEENVSSFIFIDEPETGMHPKQQVQFMKLMRKLSEDFKCQFIIATHSPFIMKNLKSKDNLYYINHNGNEANARYVDPGDKDYVFQAIGAYLPESLSSKGIIFVEGMTESRVLPILLDKIGLDIEAEGIVLIPLGGQNLFGIEPTDLKKLHDRILVIIDSDLKSPENRGGNIKKDKLVYENKCIEIDVCISLNRNFRCIENMYPKSNLAKVLNIKEEDLKYDEFSEIKDIRENEKVKIGQKVAESMTKEQAMEFPVVKDIIKWWKG